MLLSLAIACLVGAVMALKGNVKLVALASLAAVAVWGFAAGLVSVGLGTAVLGAFGSVVALQVGYFIAQYALALGHGPEAQTVTVRQAANDAKPAILPPNSAQ